MIKNTCSFLIFLFISSFFSCPSYADVIVVNVDGIVNPVMSEFISKSIDSAVEENSEALVIRLDTPGGLDTSMRSIVKKIISSEVPVVVYIAPSGARAASAGVFITLAAHVAAMAPGTNIGAAHPVAVGQEMDETMLEKAENDAAAYIRSLAERKKRNADWAESAVRESVSITHEVALKLNVIDMVATDLADLLEKIDGKTVETSLGTHMIKTSGANIKFKDMGLRDKILNIISNPNVAYLLMLLGFYGIFFELTNPGTIFPGVVGAVCLILAFYSFQTLPVNYAGLMLIILAIVLFILEIKVTSFGLLTFGGIVSMVLGSIMLFDSPLPFFRISLSVIIPSVLFTVVLFVITIRLVISAQRRKPETGTEELIGMEGKARTDIHRDGQVFVHGEIWEAWSDRHIPAGDNIIVDQIKGLKLKVHNITEDD